MRQVFIIICLLIILVGFGCKDSPQPCLTCPPGPERIIIDTLLVDPTEAWLKLRVLTDELPGTILRLTRNDKTIFTDTIGSRFDTTLHDINLFPNQPYLYKASLSRGFLSYDVRTLEVTTMDTTSHNFTWQVDTLGIQSSVFFDVAIINDTLVYAVGQFYLRDSLGNVDLEPYCLAIWNGRKWTPRRIYPRYPGYGIFPISVFRGIFVFSATDVWFADGGTAWQWDGVSDTTKWRYAPFPSPDAGATKLWGTSSQNMYTVGNYGLIAHYDGATWQKQASGTSVHLTDIWGTPDGSRVWACGHYDTDGSNVLVASRGGSGSWKVLWDAFDPHPTLPYHYYLQSLWTPGRDKFFLTGGALYYHSLIDTNRVEVNPIQLPNFAYRVRGTAVNDVFLVGDYAMVMHYNGSTWHLYEDLLDVNDQLYGLAVSDRLIVAVGIRYLPGVNRTGLIIIGKK